MDYFADALSYIENNTEDTKKDFNTSPITLLKKEIGVKGHKEELKPLKTSPDSVGIEVSFTDNANSFTFNGQTYKTPIYFNKEQLKQGDKKTIEMLLYYYGLM